MLDFALYVSTSLVAFVLSLVGDWPISELPRVEGEGEGLSPGIWAELEVGVVERRGRAFIVQRCFPPFCHS